MANLTCTYQANVCITSTSITQEPRRLFCEPITLHTLLVKIRPYGNAVTNHHF